MIGSMSTYSFSSIRSLARLSSHKFQPLIQIISINPSDDRHPGYLDLKQRLILHIRFGTHFSLLQRLKDFGYLLLINEQKISSYWLA